MNKPTSCILHECLPAGSILRSKCPVCCELAYVAAGLPREEPNPARDVLWSEVVDLREANSRLHSVLVAAKTWLRHLESNGRYLDGVPGELMDAVDAASKDSSPKP